jgi:hypothetical protein
MTELLVIGTRIFGRILEDVGRTGGETTVCEDPHLDVARVDLWEEREAAGPEFWSGFGEAGRRKGGIRGRRGGGERQSESVLSIGRGIRVRRKWTHLRRDIRRRPSITVES